MDEREEFVLRALSEEISFSQLCKDFNISRKTGYKWKERFLSQGKAGLYDLSKRPNTSPNQLCEDAVVKILRIRMDHPSWGAKKIAHILDMDNSIGQGPSISSVYRVLEKANLLKKKRIHKARDFNKENLHLLIEPTHPNDVWTVDFKGWWLSSDIKRCNPLTIRDLASRFNLDIRLTAKQDTACVQDVMEKAFKRYGLPKVIRSDNGSPFAAHHSPLGLSKLSVQWLSLGIIPDRITPGKPYQNGSHERMHRDLKQDVQKGKKQTINHYQNIIDQWKDDYNNIRPHESLAMKTPSQVYTPSPRKFTGYVEEIHYPLGFETRKVDKNGHIKIMNALIRITTALSGYHVGLKYKDEYTLELWFNTFILGEVDLVSSSFYTIANS